MFAPETNLLFLGLQTTLWMYLQGVPEGAILPAGEAVG